jgi:hypothetical protein
MTLRAPRGAARTFFGLAAAAALAGCGGGTVDNPQSTSGQRLSFAYFQRCIQPIFELPIGSAGTTNTCASGGCHDNVNGTGGALRLTAGAATVDLSDPANTADVIRATTMYRNFYSAQGATLIGDPDASLLVVKPLVRNVLHGGGLIFEDPDDPNVRLIEYWISHPMPQGHDEFSTAATGLFTPADIATGACNTQ